MSRRSKAWTDGLLFWSGSGLGGAVLAREYGETLRAAISVAMSLALYAAWCFVNRKEAP